MTIVLDVQQITRDYPLVRALDHVSFQVRQGQCFGLLGPNGAGKTTALSILESIEKPTSGEVLFKGRRLSRSYREVIGILFQYTALQDFQTVSESLQMFSALYRRKSDLGMLIRTCHLEDLLDCDTRKLSGGQRQRLLLAIALVNDPELLFLDEPTTGLDPQARRNFWHLIDALRRQGKTIVLTTHYMDEAAHLCDEVVIIDHGRIVARGSPQGLVQQHFPASIIRLPLGAWPTATPLPDGAAVSDARLEIYVDQVAPMLQRMQGMGVDLTEMKVDIPNLEDLFLKLTGHALRA